MQFDAGSPENLCILCLLSPLEDCSSVCAGAFGDVAGGAQECIQCLATPDDESADCADDCANAFIGDGDSPQGACIQCLVGGTGEESCQSICTDAFLGSATPDPTGAPDDGNDDLKVSASCASSTPIAVRTAWISVLEPLVALLRTLPSVSRACSIPILLVTRIASKPLLGMISYPILPKASAFSVCLQVTLQAVPVSVTKPFLVAPLGILRKANALCVLPLEEVPIARIFAPKHLATLALTLPRVSVFSV